MTDQCNHEWRYEYKIYNDVIDKSHGEPFLDVFEQNRCTKCGETQRNVVDEYYGNLEVKRGRILGDYSYLKE